MLLAGFLPVGVAPLCAQDATALRLRETELVQRATSGLHAVADALQDQKQHGRALALRREIWLDYDEHDQQARERSGFVRVGALWRKDDNKLVLDRDLKARRSKLRRIDRDLDKLCKQLLAEHRAIAEGWAALGDAERAAVHWRRVLRFQPGDEAAARALAIREFEGFTGSATELQMLRRGRAIRGAVDWLNRQSFPVEPLRERRLDLLEQASIAHVGVQSEFFTVWGSLPIDQLETIACDCERSLLLAHTLFAVSGGQVFTPARRRNLVFCADQAQYEAAMAVVENQFSPERFRFLRDEVDQCFVEHGGESLRLHKVVDQFAVARDQAVRGVMQDAVGVLAEGMWEGIGHAACGFLFGRTLTFLLEQQSQRTSADWTPKTLAPDLDVWMQIAQESAWAKSDTRTSELVLISAARFTTEQRVKAWAICHYLVHWRPHYVRELDRSRGHAIHTAPDVEAEFLRRTGYELPKIDLQWRAFWARGDELRAAMARDPVSGDEGESRRTIERSRALVDAVNAHRAAGRVGPIGYFLDANSDFAAVRSYRKALQKARREQQKRDRQQRKGRKVEPVEMPRPPAAIDRTVLFSTAAEPLAAVRGWMMRPDLRDQLLHPGRDLLAVPADGGGLLLGTALPAQPTLRGLPITWPRDRQRAVPGSARAGDLGRRAMAALGSAGLAPDDVVGAPLTLHFARRIKPAVLEGVQATAFDGNRPIAGVVVAYGQPLPDGAPESADGCVAFLPLKPLRAGARVEVRWQLPSVVLPKGLQMAAVVFTVE